MRPEADLMLQSCGRCACPEILTESEAVGVPDEAKQRWDGSLMDTRCGRDEGWSIGRLSRPTGRDSDLYVGRVENARWLCLPRLEHHRRQRHRGRAKWLLVL